MLLDQLVYLVHLHIVFLHARLVRVLYPKHPLRVLDLVGSLREFVLLVVYCRVGLVLGVEGSEGGVSADRVRGGDTVVFESRL